MIELPEAAVISRQITETLGGKRIASAVANASAHKFAWYTGNPAEYNDRLAGKVIGAGTNAGANIEFAAGDMLLAISAPIRFHDHDEKRPTKHQLLVTFEDGTAISSSAQMCGGFFCFPGLGNGVLQDILWSAKLHPKRKMSDLTEQEIQKMFADVKSVLLEMAEQGGRDTERDLFGQPGGYVTILSKNTVGKPCPACGTILQKEPYLGGSIYFCGGCQKI